MTALVVPFALRGARGEVRVDLRPNDDPVGLGCDLLDPGLPPDAALGFPVCRASVELDADGYAAFLGWVQLVRSTDAGDGWDLDPLAVHRDAPTPFAFFGLRPTLFDAPFRPTREALVWRAESYLCVLPDAVMSRVVEPVAAFAWGFDVVGGVVLPVAPAMLPPSAWDRHLPLLRRQHPGWQLRPAAS